MALNFNLPNRAGSGVFVLVLLLIPRRCSTQIEGQADDRFDGFVLNSGRQETITQTQRISPTIGSDHNELGDDPC
ncbi:hypothetical protein C0081_22085 [Cohaesibacter celericrescens]|uniref:Uncharacterized protein n=1 Tax=Cohaesibacter celericrescens TaxID=2067669 RepID=A0A2N5XKI2_9HYPH|nr:hypothetical protein C0081_22085 [Cohaesibacter celericrescens]